MELKRKILVCIDWYLPGYKAGGPIQSASNIINQFKHKFDFYVLTSAYDLEENEPYKNIKLNTWIDYDEVSIKYLDRSNFSRKNIHSSIVEVSPDVIYLNSLFSRVFTIYPLSYARRNKIKTILAPRGMLGKGALDIKRKKKMLFISISNFLKLYEHVIWHASTVVEKEEVEKHFGHKATVVVAQNLAGKQKYSLDEILSLKEKGVVKFVFVSRISRKKNLDVAIQAIQKLKTEKKIEFDIYGAIDGVEYFDSIKSSFIEDNNIKISYKGVLEPKEIVDVFAKANFMLLPTKHENFGHVIIESWANGCPVIISDNTPWKELQSKKLGWEIDISNLNRYYAVVQESVELKNEYYLEMVKASYQYFTNEVCDNKIVNDNLKLFSS